MDRAVLVVDDSRLARMAVSRALLSSAAHLEILEADSAEAAWRVIEVRPVAGAILDVNMAGQDGLSLARDLHARFPTLPLVILSANVQREIVDGAAALGALFLEKPLRAGALAPFIAMIDAAQPPRGPPRDEAG